MWSYQALVIFAILLPGFLARAIIESLTQRKPQGNLAAVIESFIFSFIIYVGASLICPLTIDNSFSSGNAAEISKTLSAVRPFILISLVLSIIIGIAWSFNLNHDLIHRFLRFCRATQNTSRSSTWLDTFHSMQSRHVALTLEDGRRIFGYPLYYSDDQDEGCIFLENPEWIDNEGNYIDLGVKGILITNNNKIKRIEFLNNLQEEKELKND